MHFEFITVYGVRQRSLAVGMLVLGLAVRPGCHCCKCSGMTRRVRPAVGVCWCPPRVPSWAGKFAGHVGGALVLAEGTHPDW